MNALPLANANKFRVLVLKSFISRDSIIRNAFFPDKTLSSGEGLDMKEICDIYHYTKRYYTRQTLACIGKKVAKECLTKAHSYISENTGLDTLLKCIDPHNISVSLSEDEKYALLMSIDAKESDDRDGEHKPENIYVLFAMNICKDMLSLQLEALNASLLEGIRDDTKRASDETVTNFCEAVVEKEESENLGLLVDRDRNQDEQQASGEILSHFTLAKKLEEKQEDHLSRSPQPPSRAESIEKALQGLEGTREQEQEFHMTEPFFDGTFEDEPSVEQNELYQLIQSRNEKRPSEEDSFAGRMKKARRKRQKEPDVTPLLIQAEL